MEFQVRGCTISRHIKLQYLSKSQSKYPVLHQETLMQTVHSNLRICVLAYLKIHGFFFLTSFYATFQCGRYNIFKKFLTYFFAPENMKKTPSKVAHNLPRFFFSIGPAAQTAQKQKSRTTKSPLIQDWVQNGSPTK